MTLDKEARYLHEQLFGDLPSEQVVQEYLRAHSEISALANPPSDQLRTVGIIVERRLNANGVETFLRSGQSRHLLGKKLLLLAYLTHGGPTHAMRESVHSPWRAWLYMSACVAAGAYSLARGYFQKWRHGLI